ncbi:MAG: hypothetical protein K0U45_04755, partial [Alphaproteobacteria bacterium]|nr:hypothetical protein [Alphaproteobacteria bacterium]
MNNQKFAKSSNRLHWRKFTSWRVSLPLVIVLVAVAIIIISPFVIHQLFYSVTERLVHGLVNDRLNIREYYMQELVDRIDGEWDNEEKLREIGGHVNYQRQYTKMIANNSSKRHMAYHPIVQWDGEEKMAYDAPFYGDYKGFLQQNPNASYGKYIKN